jgi:hypothetical protein
MATLQSGILLAENETLVMEIEAELWATSSNPIARFFGAIAKFIAMILGHRVKGFLVITDKRIVEIKTNVNWYCFTTGKEVKYVLPSSVKEIGYTRSATFLCCCPMFQLYYESFTQRTAVQLKGVNESGAKKVADAFYNAIIHA